MASFSGNVDLLALNGAKVLVGIDEKNTKRPYVCIPLDVNEIRVEASKNDPNKKNAKLRINIRPYNDAYKNKIRQSAAERGDSNVSVPTHENAALSLCRLRQGSGQGFPEARRAGEGSQQG